MSRFWVFYWTVILPAFLVLALILTPTPAIEAVSKVLSALSPIVAALLAIFGLYAWRLQLVAKRRFELAEEGLKATITAVMALEAVRNPFRHLGEGQTRKPAPNETPAERDRLNNEFVPIERLIRYSDEFAALEKSAVLLEVHFGNDLSQHMWEILRVRNKINAAVSTLQGMGSPQHLTQPNLDTYYMLNAVLSATRLTNNSNPARNDVLTGEIETLRGTVVQTLRPYLAEPRLFDVFRLSA